MSLRKITREQEHQLIQVFLHMGQQVVAPLCVEAGVSAGYAQNRANVLGLRAQIIGPGPRSPKRRYVDPRWKLAIQRGSIVA